MIDMDFVPISLITEIWCVIVTAHKMGTCGRGRGKIGCPCYLQMNYLMLMKLLMTLEIPDPLHVNLIPQPEHGVVSPKGDVHLVQHDGCYWVHYGDGYHGNQPVVVVFAHPEVLLLRPHLQVCCSYDHHVLKVIVQ